MDFTAIGAVHHPGTNGVPTWITIAVGATAVAAFLLSVFNYWITQRRVRPIVICHEHRKRHSKRDALDNGYWAASVYLTNESEAAAFNVQFGIDMAGRHFGWKRGRTDEKASRLKVLRPNGRYPDTDYVDVVIDDRVTWDLSSVAGDTDIDEGRIYWAYYQGPAGDWWYTANPTDRTSDFVIKRVRSDRFGPISRGNRKLVKSIEQGAEVRTRAFRELQEAAEKHRAAVQNQQSSDDDDKPTSIS